MAATSMDTVTDSRVMGMDMLMRTLRRLLVRSVEGEGLMRLRCGYPGVLD
jgi:hypothetical protein